MCHTWIFHLNKYLISALNHLKQSPFCCTLGNMCMQCTWFYPHFLVPASLPPSLPFPSLSLSVSSLSNSLSLCKLDKLLSGPEIWHIMPLCWSSFSVKPWIWMQCKWYDYSLKGTINFTIVKPFQVQRLTLWDNEENSKVHFKLMQWLCWQMNIQ